MAEDKSPSPPKRKPGRPPKQRLIPGKDRPPRAKPKPKEKPERDVTKVHPLQRAWAAGIFEAKVSWPSSSKPYYLRMDTVNEALLKRFHEIVGLGEVHCQPRPLKHLTNWYWCAQSMDECRDLLLLLGPFFTNTLVQRAADKIGIIERNKEWRRDNPEKAAKSLIDPRRKAESEGKPPPTKTGM